MKTLTCDEVVFERKTSSLQRTLSWSTLEPLEKAQKSKYKTSSLSLNKKDSLTKPYLQA